MRVGQFAKSVSRWLLFLAITSFLSKSTLAAPVTFAFEAEVTEIRELTPNSTLSLPFSLSIGDVISGSIEFEPVAFGQSTVLNSLNLQLFGHSIEGRDGTLFTGDNQSPSIRRPWIDTIRSNNDFQIQETTLPEIRLDKLILGMSGGNLLSPADHLSDVEVWNKIPPPPTTVGVASERRVGIQLTSLSGESPLTISVEVGPMRLIPEPSTIVLTGIFAAFGVLCRRYRH